MVNLGPLDEFGYTRRMDQPADSRTLLKKIALDLLVRDGYRGMSFGDIAQAAGTTRANVHYHFGSKSKLIDEVLADYVDETLEQLKAVWEVPGTPLAAKVAAMLEYSRARYGSFNAAGQPPRPWSLISRLRQDEEMLTDAGRANLRRFTKELNRLFLSAAEKAAKSKELRSGATAQAVATLLVAVADNAAPISMAGVGFRSLEAAYESILSLSTVATHA
jgi:AcrR family transcriptional regulator